MVVVVVVVVVGGGGGGGGGVVVAAVVVAVGSGSRPKLRVRMVRAGALWETKPQIHSSGLICALELTKFGITNKHVRPEQRCRATALCHTKSTCVLVDSSGNVYELSVQRNRWHHVGRGSGAATAVHCNPRRPTEIAAAFQDDNNVVCFDSHTRKRVSTLSDHRLPIHSVSFHSSGALLATGDRSCAYLWDTQSWARLRCLKQPGHLIRGLKFCPSGRFLLALFQNAATQHYVVVAWAISADGLDRSPPAIAFRARVPPRFSDGVDIDTFCCSQNDSAMVCGSPDRPGVLFWDTAKLRAGHTTPPRFVDFRGNVGTGGAGARGVFQVEFLPDGRSLACGEQDGSVSIRALNTVTCETEVLARVSVRTGGASGFDVFCLNNEASMLVGCSPDGTVRLMDLTVARATFVHHHALGLTHDENHEPMLSKNDSGHGGGTQRGFDEDGSPEEDRRGHHQWRGSNPNSPTARPNTIGRSENAETREVSRSSTGGSRFLQPPKLSGGQEVADTARVRVEPFLRKSSWVDSIFQRRDNLSALARRGEKGNLQAGGNDFFSQVEGDIDNAGDDISAFGQGLRGKAPPTRRGAGRAALPQLATDIAPAQGALNKRRLLDLYNLKGRFPSKYRRLIWRFLLR